MNGQILFSRKKKYIIRLSSAKSAHNVVGVKCKSSVFLIFASVISNRTCMLQRR